MWSREGDLYPKIRAMKRELGKIPEATCPLIDEVIKVLDKENKNDNEIRAIETLEILRAENAKLRELGISWYNFCDELSGDADKIIIELESNISELEEEVGKLKDKVEDYVPA